MTTQTVHVTRGMLSTCQLKEKRNRWIFIKVWTVVFIVTGNYNYYNRYSTPNEHIVCSAGWFSILTRAHGMFKAILTCTWRLIIKQISWIKRGPVGVYQLATQAFSHTHLPVSCAFTYRVFPNSEVLATLRTLKWVSFGGKVERDSFSPSHLFASLIFLLRSLVIW